MPKNRHLNLCGLKALPIMVLAASLCILLATPLGAALLKDSEPSKATEAPKAKDALAASKAPALSSPAAIPLPDVAKRSIGVTNLLRSIKTRLTRSAEIEDIRIQLPGVSGTVDEQFVTTRSFIQDWVSFEVLQAQQQIWEETQRHMSPHGWTCSRVGPPASKMP